MGFFDKCKRVLGFEAEDDENDIEIEGIDATVRPLSSRIAAGDAARKSADNGRGFSSAGHQEDYVSKDMDSSRMSREGKGEISVDAELELRPDPSVIFDRVVVMINESLPDFLQKSVDPTRQRQALYDALDASMKDYFAQLDKNIERRLQVRFEADRRRLQSQIDSLSEKAKREEEGNSNAKNLQLSAERQKRALSERVHDLEKQLATLEAENEQYILENKSMANKLRMAALVGDGQDDAVAAELQKREEKIAEMTKMAAELEERCALYVKEKEELQAAITKLQDENEQLAQEFEAKSSEERDDEALLVKLQEENHSLKKAADEMLSEMKRLQDSLEQAKVKDELGVAMVNDLNSKARVAKDEADEVRTKFDALQAENEELKGKLAHSESQREETDELNTLLDADLSAAKERLSGAEANLVAAQAENAALTAKLTKAQEDLKIVREIQTEVLKLEENQRNANAKLQSQSDELMEKDELIKQLQSDIMSKNSTMRMQDETIHRLEDQTDSLRKNIETTIYERTQVESALRSEIDRLKSLRGMATQPSVEKEMTEVKIVGEVEDETPDMPEFIIEKTEQPITPKPRRGRPPKHKEEESEEIADTVQKNESVDQEGVNDLELLDTTDWLIATPPENPKPKRQRKQKSQTADDSFGYKEPERQDPPDNPAQMLLW